MKKTFILLFAAVLCVLCLSSCFYSVEDINVPFEEKPEKIIWNGVTDKLVKTEYQAFPKALSATLLGKFDKENAALSSAGAVVYSENGKFGIASLDGKNDTGAVFANAAEDNGKFIVYKNQIGGDMGVDTINCCGIVDENCQVLLPQEYGYIKMYGSRYAVVIKAESIVEKEDDYHFYYYVYSENGGNIYYSGEWSVFDTQNKCFVKGLGGRDNPKLYPTESGLLQYEDENGVIRTLNGRGNPVPESAFIFPNGGYVVETANGGVLFDPEGNVVFNIDRLGFYPMKYIGNGLFVAERSVDGQTGYAVMNSNGELVSAIFDYEIYVTGRIIRCNNKIYDYEGRLLTQESYYNSVWGDAFGGSCVLENSKEQVYISAKGEVLYKCSSYDKYIDTAFQGKISDGVNGFSLADGEFSISMAGNPLIPWVYSVPNGETFDLYDSISGEILLSGYKSFAACRFDGVYIVGAVNQKGILELYSVG